jgi:hypothetical protein
VDAATLDGLDSAVFALESEVFGIVTAADGSGSGLDADLLDGLSSAAFVQTTGDQTISGEKTFEQLAVSTPATKSTTGSIAATEGFVRVNPASAAFTLTLPAIADVPAGYSIVVKDVQNDPFTNAATLQRAGADTIENGVTQVSLNSARASVTLTSDGSQWWITASFGTVALG